MDTLVFHRGGGKSLDYPPNCILTIKWAMNNGAEGVEYDVAVAKFNNNYEMVVIEPKLLKENKLDVDNLNWNDLKKENGDFSLKGFISLIILLPYLAQIY
ncbi:MAG: hypothetical protein MAG795_00271 [Candidatus Woesearchaeota archaeon]|nr:hypothetical protein [Candidatus Woesearchaeota archaeon]